MKNKGKRTGKISSKRIKKKRKRAKDPGVKCFMF